MPFGTIEQAIEDIRAGRFVVVADDEDRENEGDLVCAAELVASLAGQSKTDQPPSVQGHEVDHLGRGQFGGTDQISLVLAILIVGHDDDLSVTKVFDRLLDGAKSRHRIPAYR